MEEQAPSQPQPSTPMPPSSTGPLPAPPAPARQRGGCLGRTVAALLVILITTFLALLAGAAGLLWLGFVPSTPAQLADAEARVATLQAGQSALQTQVAADGQRGSGDHELLGEIKSQIGDIATLRAQLQSERETSAAQSATLVAEVRAGRDAVAVFATAEAGRAALLADLDRRSARVERFLARLGDIANDTATDLGSVTPSVPTLTPTPALTPSALPSATEVPSRTPAASPSPRPTSAP